MVWLSQNWIWAVVAIGVIFFLLSQRSHLHAGVGGMDGHGGMAHGPLGPVFENRGSTAQGGEKIGDGYARQDTPQAAVDPVSGEAVRVDKALTTVYRGNAYYFGSKETRERFEAAPEAYAAKGTGQPMPTAEASEYPRHRRRGC